MPPRLLLVLAAVLFSTGGAAIKLNQLTSWQVACLRSVIAACTLWFSLPGVRRQCTRQLVSLGAVYAANLILFVAATKLTTSANAIFLQSTAPIYLLFIGPLVLKEPLRRSDLALMAAMAFGMSLFFVSTEPAMSTAPNPVLGNILAAISGFAWAIVVAGLRWTGRQDKTGADGLATVFAGNLIAFLVALYSCAAGQQICRFGWCRCHIFGHVPVLVGILLPDKGHSQSTRIRGFGCDAG